MVIREMSRDECLNVLATARLFRLACSSKRQPYIVPVYLAFSGAMDCLYGFTTLGRKIEWMRENPLVCLETDELTTDDKWASVVITGRFEELSETPDAQATNHPSYQRPVQTANEEPNWSAGSRDLAQVRDEREQAWRVLQSHPEWWEPCCTVWALRTNRDERETYSPIYYKIHIDDVTGREAIPDSPEVMATATVRS